MLFNDRFDGFIADYTRAMPRSLVVAVIGQFGGMELFIKNHAKACYISNEIKGWGCNYEVGDLFTDNKDAIMTFIEGESEAFEYDDACSMIADFPIFDRYRTDESKYDSEDIKSYLAAKGSSEYNIVASALGYYIGEEVARCYEFYLQDNPICIETVDDAHCNAETRMRLSYMNM